MACRPTSDARTTARSRRRTKLAAESLESRALMAADVAPAIASIAISSEPVPGGAVGEVVTVLPMPTVFIGQEGASAPGFAGSVSGAAPISGEPIMVTCVMPEPGITPGFEKPAVVGGGPDGVENVMYTTAMVQRTNVSRVSVPRPAALVAQQRYGQPRVAPAVQQTAAPRRNNDVQATAAPTARPQQTPGHFARQIAARFGRVGSLVSR
jgi:hypothetical protein